MHGHLPGGEILDKGLDSFRRGIVDEYTVLLLIGAKRLGACGIIIPSMDIGQGLPEHKLYELLQAKYGVDAYRHYNSLNRRLVSLANALDSLSAT